MTRGSAEIHSCGTPASPGLGRADVKRHDCYPVWKKTAGTSAGCRTVCSFVPSMTGALMSIASCPRFPLQLRRHACVICAALARATPLSVSPVRSHVADFARGRPISRSMRRGTRTEGRGRHQPETRTWAVAILQSIVAGVDCRRSPLRRTAGGLCAATAETCWVFRRSSSSGSPSRPFLGVDPDRAYEPFAALAGVGNDTSGFDCFEPGYLGEVGPVPFLVPVPPRPWRAGAAKPRRCRESAGASVRPPRQFRSPSLRGCRSGGRSLGCGAAVTFFGLCAALARPSYLGWALMVCVSCARFFTTSLGVRVFL